MSKMNNLIYDTYFSNDYKDNDFLIKNIYLPKNPEDTLLLKNNKGDTYLLTKGLVIRTKKNVIALVLTPLSNIKGEDKEQLQDLKDKFDIKDIVTDNENKYLCIPFYQDKTELNLYQLPTYRKYNKETNYEIGLNPEYKKFKALYMVNNIFTLRQVYSKKFNKRALTLSSRRLDDIIITRMARVKKIWFGLDDIYFYNYKEDPIYEGKDLSKLSPSELLYIYDEDFLEDCKKMDPDFSNLDYYHDKVNNCMEPIYVVNKEELEENFNNEDFDIDNLKDDSNVIKFLFYPKTYYINK